MKSFSILLFIILVLYIFYNFSYSYFYNKNTKNTGKNVSYLILPDTFNDYYNIQSLKHLYKDMFNNNNNNNFYP